ncbi:MAG TPA: hypothetical protein VNT99_15085 [Methylomirabilota bacterium]|nr:hypothetical protein [Methylomirabilota bacterium]
MPLADEQKSQPSARTGGELFIVDNSDEAWKGLRYLQDWTEIASAFDIATGFFEIGALLALDGKWQKLDKIRILMGDEASQRTRAAILEGLQAKIKVTLDASIEGEKEKNDFLSGVDAIVAAMRSGQIECRVYAKRNSTRKPTSHTRACRSSVLWRSSAPAISPFQA